MKINCPKIKDEKQRIVLQVVLAEMLKLKKGKWIKFDLGTKKRFELKRYN